MAGSLHARRGRVVLILVAVAIALCATAARASASGLPPDWQRGANLSSWWHDEWENPSSDSALQALRDTGSTDAAFVATWYMQNPTSSAIAPDSNKTPSDAGLLRAMASAKAMGMRVVLKPHVDVYDGSFRGNLAPSDPAAWFASYETMIDHYADLANQAGASMFVVGTELTSMTQSQYTGEWLQAIAGVRARFGGSLTFAANQISGAQQAGFWGALDYIGIDAYMPLATNDPDPTVQQLVSAWSERGYVSGIGALHTQYGKPVIFTEIGYQSRDDTAETPWWTDGPQDQEPQQRAYEAAFEVWSQVPWLKGFYWWDWRPSSTDPNAGDFTARGKLAETTLRDWNTAPFVPDPQPPAGPPAPPRPRPVVLPLLARVTLAATPRGPRRGRTRILRLHGRVSAGCGVPVTVQIDQRGAHRRTWRSGRRMRASSNSRGTYSMLVRLRSGGYRAAASTSAGRCRAARSKRVYFRT